MGDAAIEERFGDLRDWSAWEADHRRVVVDFALRLTRLAVGYAAIDERFGDLLNRSAGEADHRCVVFDFLPKIAQF